MFKGHLFFGDGLGIGFMSVDELPSLNNFVCIQSQNIDDINIYSPLIIISNRYLGIYRNRLPLPSFLPEPGSTHHIITNFIMIPIKVGVIPLYFDRSRRLSPQTTNLEVDLDPSLVSSILERVRDLGPIGIDGIYMYFQGYPRGTIYSIVDRLWRMGYLRKESIGGREVYKITVKGLLHLKELGGGEGGK
jgi:predicted transcriptional regulator